MTYFLSEKLGSIWYDIICTQKRRLSYMVVDDTIVMQSSKHDVVMSYQIGGRVRNVRPDIKVSYVISYSCKNRLAVTRFQALCHRGGHCETRRTNEIHAARMKAGGGRAEPSSCPLLVAH